MPPASLPAHRDFVDHLRQESLRFREVIAAAPNAGRVPTCPDWDADDLLWHLAEVQWFWGEIVERRLTSDEQLEAVNEDRVTRPTDRAGLLAHFDRSSERLRRQLGETPPETELWMWADDHSAAYIARRQAHEALMHRIDAELVAGAARADIDGGLAADGVDEALRVMRGYEDEPGLSDVPVGGAVTIATVDAMHAWTVTPVRVTGTYDGRDVDLLRFRVADGAGDGAVALVSGEACDLGCWLWNRPTTHEITKSGDPVALGLLDDVLSSSLD